MRLNWFVTQDLANASTLPFEPCPNPFIGILFCFGFFGSTGVGIQALTLVRQVLYLWSHTSGPYWYFCFGDWVSLILPGMVSISETFCLAVGITDTYYHA